MDATAALHAVLRQSDRTPAMNRIAAEISIRLEVAGVALLPEHLSGTLNFDCDALSRMAVSKEKDKIPESLKDIKREIPARRCSSFWWASSASTSSTPST